MKSFTNFDGAGREFDPIYPPLRFNVMIARTLGAAMSIPSKNEQCSMFETRGSSIGNNRGSKTGSGETWNSHTISLEVEQSIRSVANVIDDLDHGAILMDVGLGTSLAMAKLSSMLHSNIELPAALDSWP